MHRPSVASVAILVAACGSSDPQSTGGPAGVGANNPHEAGAAESGAGGGDDQGSGSDGAAQASDDGGLGVDPLSSDASSGGTLPPLDAAPADAAPGPRTCKRGIAANAAPAAALAPSASAAGVSWWYNWASSGSGQAANIEFVPMIWG
ncbi:MAG TPA: glycosyl hydrolase, partial [Polyangiaceae bacterium]